MDIYKLYRHFWDFAFENPEKIKPTHIAIFSFAVEHCNRLGWKNKFGFPTTMVIEATGIKSYSTYKKHFEELAEFGFIEIIELSKNQHSSNIIALKENNKAPDKALDRALVMHNTKHTSNHSEYINTNKQHTKKLLNKNILLSELKNSDVENQKYLEIAKEFVELVKKNLIDAGSSTTTIEKVKATWYDDIRFLVEVDKQSIESIKKVLNFLKNDVFWKTHILSTKDLRKKFPKLLLSSNKNNKTKLANRGFDPNNLCSQPSEWDDF